MRDSRPLKWSAAYVLLDESSDSLSLHWQSETDIFQQLSKTSVASMMSADDVFTKRLVAAPNKEIKVS